MSDVANFNVISEYIPGLTHYRFTMANLHRLQYGRCVPVPLKTLPRLRICQQRLDHFLSFITSPHLVQDLQFGEKELKMSSGKTIKVPNIIRTMIPQIIVNQYSQYCKENNFQSFSKSTMLRVLQPIVNLFKVSTTLLLKEGGPLMTWAPLCRLSHL
jgi:hypothetical protein